LKAFHLDFGVCQYYYIDIDIKQPKGRCGDTKIDQCSPRGLEGISWPCRDTDFVFLSFGSDVHFNKIFLFSLYTHKEQSNHYRVPGREEGQ
jgi:hypothetical protein